MQQRKSIHIKVSFKMNGRETLRKFQKVDSLYPLVIKLYEGYKINSGQLYRIYYFDEKDQICIINQQDYENYLDSSNNLIYFQKTDFKEESIDVEKMSKLICEVEKDYLRAEIEKFQSLEKQKFIQYKDELKRLVDQECKRKLEEITKSILEKTKSLSLSSDNSLSLPMLKCKNCSKDGSMCRTVVYNCSKCDHQFSPSEIKSLNQKSISKEIKSESKKIQERKSESKKIQNIKSKVEEKKQVEQEKMNEKTYDSNTEENIRCLIEVLNMSRQKAIYLALKYKGRSQQDLISICLANQN